MNNFYLPKILYDNISHISKEKKQSISKTITEYIEYAIKNKIQWTPDSVQVPNKINDIPAVHFTARFTSKNLHNIISEYGLNNAQIIQAIQYGLYQDELKRRNTK